MASGTRFRGSVLIGLVAAGAAPALAAGTAPARVFDAGELPPSRYAVVERLWTGTWQASFRVPTHADSGAAVAALTQRASALGADGVVNLHCHHDRGAYYCYGLAVKLK
jgi:uncharacterized protein YbjQ (UPF0145 family)